MLDIENKVIYDALSITSKIHQASDIIEMLGLQAATWQTVKGAHGYQDRLYYECISIHFNGTPEMGVWLEMMGQGCRAFETYGNGDYEALFQEVLYNAGEMKITRLDVAYDDLSGILDINTLCKHTREQSYVSRFTDWQIIEGSKGNSITHGSMKSDAFIRIYDKAMERGFTDGRHWIRVEIQLRRERAMQFAGIKGNIGLSFAGVLANYVRYVREVESDGNRWRYPLQEYWATLLSDAERIRLYEKPGSEYNLGNLEESIFKQRGNAIETYIDIFGEKDFFEKLKERNIMPNPKYEELKRKYKNEEHIETELMQVHGTNDLKEVFG